MRTTVSVKCPHCSTSVSMFPPRAVHVTKEKPYRDDVITCSCKKKYYVKLFVGGRSLIQKL